METLAAPVWRVSLTARNAPCEPSYRPRVLLVAEVQARVARHFDIPTRAMTATWRNRIYVRPRQIAMYLARHYTPRSLPEIGRLFGNRDHTTVIHGIKMIERLRETDAELDADVRSLEAALESPVRQHHPERCG